MNEILNRRRGLMGLMGASDFVTGTVTVSEDRKIAIPLADGKTKLAFFVEGDAEYKVNTYISGGFMLPYLSTEKVYRIRIDGAGQTPPSQSVGAITPTISSTEITIAFTNGNTSGLAKPGTTVRYFWW